MVDEHRLVCCGARWFRLVVVANVTGRTQRLLLGDLLAEVGQLVQTLASSLECGDLVWLERGERAAGVHSGVRVLHGNLAQLNAVDLQSISTVVRP